MDSSSGAIATRIDDITPGTTILNKVGLGGDLAAPWGDSAAPWGDLAAPWGYLAAPWGDLAAPWRSVCVCLCVGLGRSLGGTWPLQGGGTWPLIGGDLAAPWGW